MEPYFTTAHEISAATPAESYQLVCDQTKEVIKEGTSSECFAAFHRVSGFSYHSHKQYSFDTYTVQPKPLN